MNVRPADALVEPSAADPIPDLLERSLGLYFISPSFYIAEVCKFVCGGDPWSWAARHYSGDWEAVLRASDGVRNLGGFHRAYSLAATDVRGTVSSWTGPAGAAAGRHLDSLADALGAQSVPIDEIAKQLEQIAVGMYEIGQAYNEILSAMTDAAIIFLVKCVASAVSGATGVGAAASLAAAGSSVAELAQIANLWSRAMTAHTTAWTAVQGLTGLLVGNLASLENIEIPRLPSPPN